MVLPLRNLDRLPEQRDRIRWMSEQAFRLGKILQSENAKDRVRLADEFECLARELGALLERLTLQFELRAQTHEPPVTGCGTIERRHGSRYDLFGCNQFSGKVQRPAL
jgi:hypothetical protein